MGNEGCFPSVSISNVNIIVSPLDMKFGKDLGIFDVVNEGLDKGEGVGVFNSVTIDISVVLAGSKSVRGIFLINKEEGCGLGGV